MTEKQKQELLAKLKAFTEERNQLAFATDERALEIIKERDYIANELTKDHDDYDERMQTLEESLTEQEKNRNQVLEFDRIIQNITPTQVLSSGDFGDFVGKTDQPVTGQALQDILSSGIFQPRHKKRPFYENIGRDFFDFIQKTGMNDLSRIKSKARYTEKTNLGDYSVAATFHAVLGENPQEREATVKALAVKSRFGQEEFLKAYQKGREAIKSMFTQQPDLSGGDGSLYAPTTEFAGNTGGLCEYDIDNNVYVLPYPVLKYLSAIPMESIPKTYRLFVKQTLRVNNASGVNETIYSPPVDYIVDKPESQFGFTQDRAYTIVYADTLPISEEFMEECESIMSVVKTQLLRNPLEVWADEMLNGTGLTGKYPTLTGFMNTTGISTRIHQGAASYRGVAQGAGVGTDVGRDTLERAVFDSEAFGFVPDAAIISHNDFVDMRMRKKSNSDEYLYTKEELEQIRGANLIYDTRQTDGLALVAPCSQVTKGLIRRGLQFDIGWVNSQFTQDAVTLRVRIRAGNMVTHPFALIRVSALVF